MNGNGRWGITARVSGRGIETLRIFPHPEERGEPEPTCHVALRKWGRLDLVTSCFGMAAEALPVGVLKGAHDFAAICELVETHRLERPAGTVEVFEGDPCGQVYFVVSGWLAASKAMADGHRQIVDIVLAGGMLDPASAGCDRSTVEVESLTRAVLVALPRESWFRLLGLHPGLRQALLCERTAVVSRLSARMLRLGKGSAENRVAYALCELCLRSSGAGLEEHRPYHIPMNQPLLGDFCGLSSVHVCRTLRRLETQGIIERSHQMDIVIRDLCALAEIAQVDPETMQREILPATDPELWHAFAGSQPARRCASG